MSKPFLRVFLGLALAGLAAASHAEGPDRVEATYGLDRFLAGGNASVGTPVAGDLIAAGGNVDVDAPVAGDAIVAGGNVRINGEVKNGIYGAGGQVAINAPVGRNVRMAGGRVEIGPNARIAGNVTVGGGEFRMRGAVQGYVQVAGGRVFIDGPVGGDVVATSGEIELGPNARIAGKLRHTAEELERDPAARVAGPVEHFGRSSRERHSAPGEGFRGGWFWTVGLMALAALYAGAVPSAALRVRESLAAQPGLSVLAGFIALVCVPAAAILLAITIIGIPLALLAILLYLALLLVGYVTTAVAVGAWGLVRWKPEAMGRAGWRILAAVLAVLVLSLLGRVPFLGGVVILAAIVLGIGAIFLAFRGARAAAAA